MSNFVSEWNDSFEFKFVPPDMLAKAERSVFDMTGRIAGLVGGLPSQVQKVKISETMRPETGGGFSEALGLWIDPDIIVKRSEFASVERYAAVLLHEIAHAPSGDTDITMGLDQELTALFGKVTTEALRKTPAGIGEQQEPARVRALEIPAAWRQPQAASRQPASAKKAGFWARLFG